MPVCAKPDGLTPVVLRAKRSLIAPSRPSSSHCKWKFGSLEAWRFGFAGGAPPHTLTSYLTARNGGRRSRSAAEPQSDRRSPKRFAPLLASLRSQFPPDTTVFLEASLSLAVGPIGPIGHIGRRLTPPCTTTLPVARRGVLWPWKVWRFAPARSVLCSPFSKK